MTCIAHKMNDITIADIKQNITTKAHKYSNKYAKTKNAINTEKTILATVMRMDNEVKECSCARCKYERFDPFVYKISRTMDIEYKKQIQNGFKYHTTTRNKYDFITNITNAIATDTKITYPIQKLNYLSRLFIHRDYNIFTKIKNECNKISTQYVNMRTATFVMFETLDKATLRDQHDYEYGDVMELYPFQMAVKNGRLTEKLGYSVNEVIDIEYESIDDGWLYYIKENEILRLKPIFVYILESHSELPYQDITLLAFKDILPQIDLRHNYIAKYIIEVIYRDKREKNDVLFDTLHVKTKNVFRSVEDKVDLIPTKRDPRPSDLYYGYNLFAFTSTLKLTDFINNFFCEKKDDRFFFQIDHQTNSTSLVEISKKQLKRIRKKNKVKQYDELEHDLKIITDSNVSKQETTQQTQETRQETTQVLPKSKERQVLFFNDDESDSESETESETESESGDKTDKTDELRQPQEQPEHLPITYRVDISTESKNIIETSIKLLLKTNSNARETFNIYTEYVVIKDLDKHYTRDRYINMYLTNPSKQISSPLYHLYLNKDNTIRDITYVSSCF